MEREIAGGGMGMIYEATDTRLGRPVALKMPRQVFFATELDRVRFQKEAELTSLLDHPHIVLVYDVDEVDGQPYFAMKVIQGGNLADHLAEKSLPTREAVALMIQVASAIHHAHQRGVKRAAVLDAPVLAAGPMSTPAGIYRVGVSKGVSGVIASIERL